LATANVAWPPRLPSRRLDRSIRKRYSSTPEIRGSVDGESLSAAATKVERLFYADKAPMIGRILPKPLNLKTIAIVVSLWATGRLVALRGCERRPCHKLESWIARLHYATLAPNNRGTVFDLPGWVVPITLFLATELGAAIWFAARLKSAVETLADKIEALEDSDISARLTRSEVTIEQHGRALERHQLRLDERAVR